MVQFPVLSTFLSTTDGVIVSGFLISYFGHDCTNRNSKWWHHTGIFQASNSDKHSAKYNILIAVRRKSKGYIY